MTATSTPVLVDQGWTTSVPIVGGDDHRRALLFYDDGTIRFKHTCDRGERGVIVCAPALQTPHVASVRYTPHVTVTPSIRCPDCGTHGFITDGRWWAV